MKIGFTSMFETYSSAEYTLLSNSLKELSFRLLTVILLYFNLSPKDYITAAHHNAARKAAGWAGMLFSVFSILDAGIRSKFKKVRIFDELSIGCILISLGALFFSMFEEISYWFFAIAGVSGLFVVCQVIQTCYNKFCGEAETAPKLNENLTHFIAAIKKEAEAQAQDDNHTLGYVALILHATAPEDPTTLAILKIVKQKYEPTNPTNV